MADEDLYIDRDALWRVYRDPVHGLCLAVTVTRIAWYDLAIRMDVEEAAAFAAGDLTQLADQAERLRAWPNRFSDRLVKDERPRRL